MPYSEKFTNKAAWLHKVVFGRLQVCCTVLLLSGQLAYAENVGLYEKVWDDGVNSGYQLVWSTYNPNIDSEPLQPDDFYVTPLPGGYCDPITGICNAPQSDPGAIQSGGDELPPMVVTTARVDPFLWAYLMFMQGGGGTGGPAGQELIGRPIPGNDLPTNCQDGYDDNLLDEIFSDPSLLSSIQQLVLDSNFDALITLPPGSWGRVENGAFLVPDGLGGYDFQRIGVDIGQDYGGTACTLNAGLPPGRVWAPGTIFVHTHPWSAGDDQSLACGPGYQPYTVGPGDADRLFLLGEGIGIGIIIDIDGVTVYYDSELISEISEARECY